MWYAIKVTVYSTLLDNFKDCDWGYLWCFKCPLNSSYSSTTHEKSVFLLPYWKYVGEVGCRLSYQLLRLDLICRAAFLRKKMSWNWSHEVCQTIRLKPSNDEFESYLGRHLYLGTIRLLLSKLVMKLLVLNIFNSNQKRSFSHWYKIKTIQSWRALPFLSTNETFLFLVLDSN